MASTVTAPALAVEALDQLRADFRGEVVEPADPAYDELRGVFNGMFDRRPRVILRPAGAADVVTADGELVTTSEDENPELLWGLRGGGCNFGVVTETEFKLGPLAPIVYGGLAAFDPAKGADVVRAWRDLSHGSDDIGWAVACVTAPPFDFVPEEWRGKPVVAVLGMVAGAHDAAEKVLAPLRALGPAFDLWQPMPYTVVQGLIDPANPYGRQNYWRAHNLDDLPDSVIDTFLEAGASRPSPFTAVIMLNGGGAIGNMGEDDTAISGRKSPFNFHLNGMWEDQAATAENVAWVKGVSAALAPHISTGISLNFATEIGAAALTESFGAKKVERLRALKDRYDPTNLFRMNQNIAPSAS